MNRSNAMFAKLRTYLRRQIHPKPIEWLQPRIEIIVYRKESVPVGPYCFDCPSCDTSVPPRPGYDARVSQRCKIFDAYLYTVNSEDVDMPPSLKTPKPSVVYKKCEPCKRKTLLPAGKEAPCEI